MKKQDQSYVSKASRWAVSNMSGGYLPVSACEHNEELFTRMLLVHGMPPEWHVCEGRAPAERWETEVRLWLFRTGSSGGSEDRENTIERFGQWCMKVKRYHPAGCH